MSAEYTVADVPLGFAPVPPQLVMWSDAEGKPLTGTELRVWTLFAMHRDLVTQKTSAGVIRMSKMLDVDRTTIQRAVNRLKEAGFLLHKARQHDRETGEFRPATFTLAINGKPLRFGVVTEADEDQDHHDASAHKSDGHHDAHHDASLHTKREFKETSSPRGTVVPISSVKTAEKPAKVLTTLTVDRTREVGMDPAPHQIANWGRGWSKFVYVKEGEEPPGSERQFAVLAEIVEAAKGKAGKARFFLSVEDAVKRVDGNAGTNGTAKKPPKVRYDDDGNMYVNGVLEV